MTSKADALLAQSAGAFLRRNRSAMPMNRHGAQPQAAAREHIACTATKPARKTL